MLILLSENKTISYLGQIREKFCIKAVLHDLYPNHYDLIVAIGWIKNPDFHPPSVGFIMSALVYFQIPKR